ncbi:hypothetical protein [Nonomuraea sp. SBT364]|uniref:hypothetical protein n=1 Tax=Nonomuraea sp. SBT364 TaxID=1580530 RepID=UPI0012E1B341|nr:hypothetical protein [Nonomuraea sp. SBT364]
MKETHIQELMELERQKSIIYFAAVETAIDEKIQASEKRMVHAITDVVTNAVVTLKAEIMVVRDELKETRTELKETRTELKETRTELKADIHRLEEKIGTHTHN